MRGFALFLIFVNILTICLSARAIGYYHDPKHPGKCAISESQILEPGEHPDPGKCASMFCIEDGTVSFMTCGIFHIEPKPGCKVVKADPAVVPYPECCIPIVQC